jgi:hypothetical protein
MSAPNLSEISSATTGWFPVLFPVFTLLLGFAIKFVSDWVQHKRDLERDRETRKEARHDLLAERRTDFQRQTLLDLQEAVQDIARAAGAVHVEDARAYKQTGQWQKQRIPEELDQQILLANRRVMLLNVRVRDAELRQLVEKVAVACSHSEHLSKDSSMVAIGAVGLVLIQVHERIGTLLRTLDDEEASL